MGWTLGMVAARVGATAAVVAALGGFFLASFHARKILPPKGVVVLHAGLAVVGFLLLAGGVFSLI